MSEKELERSIVKLCRLYSCEVDEFSQRRRGRCHKCGMRIYAGSQQTKGIPDLRVCWADVVCWLEVKWDKNKPSVDQCAWMEREIAAGRFAAPVWSIDDAIFALSRLGVPMQRSEELQVHPRTEAWVNKWRLPDMDTKESPADTLAGELGI